MKPLVQLSESISSYNSIGKITLPMLKIAIIQTRSLQYLAMQIINELGCHESTSFAKMIGIGGCQIFRSTKVYNLQIYLIDYIFGEEALEDRQFNRRRKVVQNLRSNKQIYFLHLSNTSYTQSQINNREEVMELKRINSFLKKDLLWKGAFSTLCRDLISLWQTANRFNIMTCLEDLKNQARECQKEEKRQKQWLKMLNHETDPLSYAFHLNYISKSYLVNSFEGYYSPQSISFPTKYSIHWQIMDILEDLWKEQGNLLKEDLQKMPLSYIEEMLKLNDFNTIGGFLPESCFLQIFKPLLQRFSEATIQCLEAVKYKILQNVQMVFEYYYSKTNIKQALIDLELTAIEAICDRFLEEVFNSIDSQISYVYAPAQSFWEMRNIKSGLYSPEQQANIQIKYIGKIYVRKVYESIRQSVPRFLGQGLLRKISKHIVQNSMKNLLAVIKENPIAILLTASQKQQIEQKQEKKKQCQKLIHYLSLKVNSTYLLKNLHSKFENKWKRTFQRECRSKEQRSKEAEEGKTNKRGFFNWMKRLFRGQEEERIPRKANSIEKSAQIESKLQTKHEEERQDLQKTTLSITDKTWILIINNHKKPNELKIMEASCEGFPEKLRPNIWYWLSVRNLEKHHRGQMNSLLQSSEINMEIRRQIEKDLGRTPPSQLFRKKYRQLLKRVLEAYSLIDRHIEYTQGMNFIAAIVICTLINYGLKDDYLIESLEHRSQKDLEERAFLIFRYLMEQTGFRKMMLIQRGYIAQLCYKLQGKIQELSPTVIEMIRKSGFTAQIIFGPLLISGLLTWSNRIEIKQRIADIILTRGVEVLYQVAAGVAAMSEEELSRLQSQEVYDFLRNKAFDSFYDKVGPKGLTQLFQSF